MMAEGNEMKDKEKKYMFEDNVESVSFQEADKNKSKELATKEEELNRREEALAKREQDNETLLEQLKKEAENNQKRSADLTAREKAESVALTRKKEEAEERLAGDIEDARMQRLAKLDEDISRERASRTKSLDEEIANRKQTFESDLQMKRAAMKAESEDFYNRLEEERKSLEEEWKKATKKAQELEEERRSLEQEKRRVEYREKRLDTKEEQIDEEVTTRFNGRDRAYEAQQNAYKDQISTLQQSLQEREKRLQDIESAQMVYGNVGVMNTIINNLRTENDKLKEELQNRPGPEVADECERLRTRIKELQGKLVAQQDEIWRAYEIKSDNDSITRQLRLKEAEVEDVKGCLRDTQDLLNSTKEELERLRAAKVTPADRERRMDSIREPYLSAPLNAREMSKEEIKKFDEMVWLKRVSDLCSEYGIKFPSRILLAFHTALKISRWSTITVLAGVSGTGKSELPRLYSRFGGLNFINVPVQPNWDSQESMLGFFNSIDNKFDAQPMLRFLYQCTDHTEDDPKLSHTMAIALLDEMNLAHVEHYFADFLDKLEIRRSTSTNNVPQVDVSLGAGVKPYGLPLLPNVLFCGTMNQDETTKALSDKVLDRGIVIFFPRPKHLYDRESARNIDEFCKDKVIQPLSLYVWNSWRIKKIPFTGEQQEELNRYKQMVEQINDYLAEAGRAIGHRVWQSIAHYVVNYPLVRKAFQTTDEGVLSPELKKAMHTAIEDQLVQKVMPKLRGIDTNGRTMDNCLQPVRTLLNENDFNLDEDFGHACEMGYGQFMWCSADYIETDSEDIHWLGEPEATHVK
jgi:hypothetical protein